MPRALWVLASVLFGLGTALVIVVAPGFPIWVAVVFVLVWAVAGVLGAWRGGSTLQPTRKPGVRVAAAAITVLGLVAALIARPNVPTAAFVGFLLVVAVSPVLLLSDVTGLMRGRSQRP